MPIQGFYYGDKGLANFSQPEGRNFGKIQKRPKNLVAVRPILLLRSIEVGKIK
jgi:hypothetical protein